MDNGYPMDLSLWRLPLGVSRVNAVFVEPTTGTTYYFVGNRYYVYNDVRGMVGISFFTRTVNTIVLFVIYAKHKRSVFAGPAMFFLF